ncbi:MAG: hypothetical protein CMJ58_27650 [Planctomycetaceae bacterium]|jgi:hypothetical protein|nr:hypothetical protein [Planctomycetaceae bacterium]
MGLSCSRQGVAEIIPDRDVMVNIVDQIVAFEELLKAGQPLSRGEEKDLAHLRRITCEMRKLNNRDMKIKARHSTVQRG